MQRRSFILAALACAVSPAVLADTPAGSLQVAILGTPREGSPIFLTVKGCPPGTTGSVHWMNEVFPLTPAGDNGVMRTMLAVPVDSGGGAHALLVDLGSAGSVRRTVTVQHRYFPNQSIWLPAATMANYDTPQNHADDAKIIERLKQFDPKQHWKGAMSFPVSARESTGFGEHRTYNGGQLKSWHKGLDLAAESGTPIKAPGGGVVALATLGLVNGNTVAINHGLGLGTVYLHMSRYVVSEGDEIEKGQVIGYVGGTGGFAPHLHWEARVHGVPIDPHMLVSFPSSWR